MFPGFAERRTVPLPGKLESLPILDTVTKTLTWPVSLKTRPGGGSAVLPVYV